MRRTRTLATFGTYEKDITSTKKPIEWIPICTKKGKTLMLSKYALDIMPYNEEFKPVTWETCTLRKWLNGEFYDRAFTDEEKEMIVSKKLVNQDNPSYCGKGGRSTIDKVFLLSHEELEKYFPEKDGDSFFYRKCTPTQYTASRPTVFQAKSTQCCDWWLRTPGFTNSNATGVDFTGFTDKPGYYVDSGFMAVRPAILVNRLFKTIENN